MISRVGGIIWRRSYSEHDILVDRIVDATGETDVRLLILTAKENKSYAITGAGFVSAMYTFSQSQAPTPNKLHLRGFYGEYRQRLRQKYAVA